MTGPVALPPLLEELLGADPPPFALLHRPTRGGDDIEILTGRVGTAERITDIPLRTDPTTTPRTDVVALVPYRQLSERGLPAPDDGSALFTMTVERRAATSARTLLGELPSRPIEMRDEHFQPDDDDYAELVRAIVTQEIGPGAGSNFVIRRELVADLGAYSHTTAIEFFRRLVAQETGAYWTFIVHTGDRTLVGASPERHVSVRDGVAVMNPISGTYRYPSSGPTVSGLIDFLHDRKEIYELHMVVDEELKMMAGFCEPGVRVVGPFLKEMAKLAHTEYYIEGTTHRDVREVLRATLFAPTVTGSPLESASRVIARHEPAGRGYYAGVVAALGRDGVGGHTLDSAILIRTADIDRTGRMRIGVGATVVRDSEPADEVAETHAKATGLLSALRTPVRDGLRSHPDVQNALVARNADLAPFWLKPGAPVEGTWTFPADLDVLVVDAEDTFTSMMGHLLRSLGGRVTIRRYDEPDLLAGEPDLVILGPGPGDPLDGGDPRIAALNVLLGRLMADRRPFLAVCLSHQVLANALGFAVRRRNEPNQGVRRTIRLFGRSEAVGFYNSFAAYSDEDRVWLAATGDVTVERDDASGEVHAIRGDHFVGVQFHPESVLTGDGRRILQELGRGLLTDPLRSLG